MKGRNSKIKLILGHSFMWLWRSPKHETSMDSGREAKVVEYYCQNCAPSIHEKEPI